MLNMLIAALVAAQTYVTNLTNDTITSEHTTGTLSAGIRINNDGTIDEYLFGHAGAGDEWNQLFASTDWIIPNSGVGLETWHVKLDHNSGDPLDGSSDTDGSWIALGTSKQWYITRINALGDGLSTANVTLSISKDGGTTTEATADYVLRANNV